MDKPGEAAAKKPPAAGLAPASPDAAPAIEADDAASDAGYESELASRTSTSVCSSVRDYEFENNRRYHRFQEGRYQFPNDDLEQEREDMKHAMVVHLCDGKLHHAPLEDPRRILDVGTGTGIWAIDMGDEYPGAEITGIDLSPIQPQWVPPNVRFMVDDAEADWVVPPNSLDYIHIRHMTSSVRDWPTLLSRAHKALKPGGWVELQDLQFQVKCDDGTVRADHKLQDFFQTMVRALEKFDVDLLAMRDNKQKVLDAGFVDVAETPFKVPIGVWPRDPRMKMIGLYNRSMMLDALYGVAVRPFTRGLGWTLDEVELYLVDVRRDLMDTSQHGYTPFHVVIGRKPGSCAHLIPALTRGAKIIVNDGALPEPGTAGSIEEKTMRTLALFMQVFVNAREREPEDWRQLFARADQRFGFVDVWRPERSSMWFVGAEWTGE